MEKLSTRLERVLNRLDKKNHFDLDPDVIRIIADGLSMEFSNILLEKELSEISENKTIIENIKQLNNNKKEDIELPDNCIITTPLFKGKVFLKTNGAKYWYVNNEGAVIISPNSQKMLKIKLQKYING